MDNSSKKIRVLVVDDEHGIRKIFCAAIEQTGYYADSAASGRDALLLLMKDHFDVLVVDLNMGEMNGITFLQEALKIWPTLGVIIVSGYVTENVVEKANKLGIVNILNKPIQLQTLCETIESEYKRKQEKKDCIPAENALILMRNHLNILTHLSNNIVGNETLPDILVEFSNSIAEMLPSSVIGILIVDEKANIHVSIQKPVSSDFIAKLKNEMITRYTAITGKTINNDEITTTINSNDNDTGNISEIGSIISVPAIIDQDINGLLTLASENSNVYQPHDVTLLYHAANHISAAFAAMQKMNNLITKDPLTGAYNRIRLNEELERAWLTSHRYNYSTAIIIVDIDNFKPLNDTYGHSVGDEILCAFAEIMQNVARTTDLIARYGGDEFVAILPRATQEDAMAFGERLMKRTREFVFKKNGKEITISISVGIATSMSHAKPASYSEMMIQADQALYTAKNSGRNCICIWPEHTCSSIVQNNTPDSENLSEFDNDAHQTTDDYEEHPGRIILIDDEEPTLKVIKAMLEIDGYEVSTFMTATEALKHLETTRGYYNVLLTDLGLPDMSGLELMHKASDIDPALIKIVISGQATVDSAINALREGAQDFIQKPVIREQLSAMIEHALEFYNLKRENERHQIHLEETVNKRSAQLAATLEEMKRSYEFTLEAMVAMLDAREKHTAKHSMRTRSMAIIMAKQLNMPKEDIKKIATGALLHDIGKIGIPDSVLLKQGKLTDEDWEVMKQHPLIGYNIMKSSPYLKDAAQIVYQHQERYDGNGYPQQLKGEEICIGARIFSLIDAYDAMRTKRIYRGPISEEEAIAEIKANSGSQFDPKLVEEFLKCQPEIEKLFSESQS